MKRKLRNTIKSTDIFSSCSLTSLCHLNKMFNTPFFWKHTNTLQSLKTIILPPFFYPSSAISQSFFRPTCLTQLLLKCWSSFHSFSSTMHILSLLLSSLQFQFPLAKSHDYSQIYLQLGFSLKHQTYIYDSLLNIPI